jgi:hypothetical protein
VQYDTASCPLTRASDRARGKGAGLAPLRPQWLRSYAGSVRSSVIVGAKGDVAMVSRAAFVHLSKSCRQVGVHAAAQSW